MIDPCCGPRGGRAHREALLSAGQRQLVNVLDPTRSLVQLRPSLKLWKVVPPIDWWVLVVPSCQLPNVVSPMVFVDPLNLGVDPE